MRPKTSHGPYNAVFRVFVTATQVFAMIYFYNNKFEYTAASVRPFQRREKDLNSERGSAIAVRPRVIVCHLKILLTTVPPKFRRRSGKINAMFP